MAITIKRKTSWIGTGSAVTLKVNGNNAGKIANHEEMQVEIPEKSATLHVSQFGGKSQKIRVEDGDKIELTTTKMSVTLYYLFFICLYVAGFSISNFGHKVVSVGGLFLIFSTSYFFVDQFQLKVMDDTGGRIDGEA